MFDIYITVYFLIIAVVVSLLFVYCVSNKSPPLAAIFFLIGILQGLVFKPLLLILFGNESFIGLYILSDIDPIRFWVGGTYIAFLFLLITIIILGLEYSLKLSRNSVGFGYYLESPKIYFDTIICSLFLVLAFIAFILFLISNPELIYLKGKNTIATNDINSYSANGFTRLMINFANIVVFLMIHNIVVGFRVRRSRNIAILAALMYLVYAVLSDQRALILFSVLSWGLFIYICGIRFSRKLIAITLLLPILAVVFTTFLRISRKFSDVAINLDIFSGILANFAGQNFIDITKTISIFDSQYELRYGSTFFETFSILIPRSLYPEKQTVNIDTLIASEIYGIETYGSGALPPGMIGEMLFNFGLIGIPVGLMLTGFFIWLVDSLRYSGRSLYLMFYSMSLYLVGIGILGSSFQSTFLGFLMVGIPLFVLHKISLKRLSRPF